MEIQLIILDNEYYKEFCLKDFLKLKLLYGFLKIGLEFY